MAKGKKNPLPPKDETEKQGDEIGGEETHPGAEPEKVRSIQYEVLKKCFGIGPHPKLPDSFRTRLFRRGERLTLDSDIPVPKHFHNLENPTPEQARSKRRAINSRKVKRISSVDN